MVPFQILHMEASVLVDTSVQLGQKDHLNILVQMELTVTPLDLRERSSAFPVTLEDPVLEKV